MLLTLYSPIFTVINVSAMSGEELKAGKGDALFYMYEFMSIND